MQKIILSIDGMTCSACSNGLEKYLNKQEGINDAIVNLVLATATIECEDNIIIDILNKYVEEAGFKSLGLYNPENIIKDNTKNKNKLIIFTIISICLLYISMGDMLKLPHLPYININNPYPYTITLLLITITYLIYGYDILKNGYKNLIHKTPNMDTLVSIGVLSSFLYSIFNTILIFLGHHSLIHHLYYESSAIVIFFIKFGRYIDSKSKDKTKSAIEKLVTITPSKATLKTKTGLKEVTLDEINEGDILIVKPGEKIAVDGIITKGTSHIDESFITGESIPVNKKEKDKVIAGSINYDGYLEYKATDIGKNSTISKIVRLVVEASNTKMPISRLADKVSSIFVPFILILAIISLIISLIITRSLDTSINTFVSVLVVACPCALGLATPLAVIVSEGLCAENGLLVKSSEILEVSSNIDTIVFDKTGTLTYGNLNISKIFNYSTYSDKELISLATSIENLSTHPISSAFINYAKNNKLKLFKVEGFNNLLGLGIEGIINNKKYILGSSKTLTKYKIKNDYIKDEEELANSSCSIVYIIEDKKIIGLVGVKDIVREEAASLIKNLHSLNKEIIMLSGDNELTANSIANSLGIKNVIANVVPTEKADVIKKLQKDGKKVMMIGDGINDAPSLTISDVGISIGSGTDIANDSSNVILLSDNLNKIELLLNISENTTKIIKQNLFWAFFYNICMIPIALGILKPLHIELNPMIASFAMMLSSLSVIANTLRLKYIKLERKK